MSEFEFKGELVVIEPQTWVGGGGGWYGIADDSGVIAYAGTEELAWLIRTALAAITPSRRAAVCAALMAGDDGAEIAVELLKPV
jgi:hypothetical protein